MMLFSIPAQAASSERFFSALTYIVNKHRCALQEDRAAALITSYCRNKLRNHRVNVSDDITYPAFGKMFEDVFIYNDWQQYFEDIEGEYTPPKPGAEDEESEYDFDADDEAWVEEAAEELIDLLADADADEMDTDG